MRVPSVHRWTKKKKKMVNQKQLRHFPFGTLPASGINLDPLPMGEVLPREGGSSLNGIGHNSF